MKLANLPQPQHDWPQSWVEANRYDREESEDSVEVTPYGDLYRLRTKLLLDLLQRYVSVGRAIIDIAAAQGSFTEKFAGLGYRVTWNDIRPELSQYVALKTKGLTITYMPGNIFEIDPVLFDAAVACEIIEHVAHPDQFLKRVAQFITQAGTSFFQLRMASTSVTPGQFSQTTQIALSSRKHSSPRMLMDTSFYSLVAN